jgi:hypothetical protein
LQRTEKNREQKASFSPFVLSFLLKGRNKEEKMEEKQAEM